ncbi:unnamed protein product [Protopolystoma xenopodis]|uniref:Uncharacterized protein n=1 Tax=Protopolystoma xenopodis TaxID=117903 RepID=A0A448X136_9PLAT|nr:unnamed protein product [Protopolystoma xenopodis]
MILLKPNSTLGQVRRVDIPSLDIVQNEKLIHIVEAAISKLYPSCIVPHLADAVETCPASSSISAADTIVSSVDVSSSAGLVSSSSTNTLCNIQTPVR